ncbi:MAG: response regulator RpfG family c-di-GMP phosphodiesterase [Bermanella sp.]
MNHNKLNLKEDSSDSAAVVTEWQQYWYVLIVDDEESVHQVTTLSLYNFEFSGRPLKFLHAYSGREALDIMRAHSDVAVVLMDVVMETDHAGLDAVKSIREDLGNQFVRIILRTGQPGQAPERKVITDYGINDYKEKTELTSTKLFTAIYTAISSYRDLTGLEANRRGLRKVIDASLQLLQDQSLVQFSQGLLEQLAALLYVDKAAFLLKGRGLAILIRDGGKMDVLAGVGRHAPDEHGHVELDLTPEQTGLILRSVETGAPYYGDTFFIQGFSTPAGVQHVVYLESGQPFSEGDRDLVELFCRNAALCMENIELNEQMRTAQSELILMLSEAIERRSNEAGNHVRRVAEYSALLAQLAGKSEEEIDIIKTASPLHDAGKIATPDNILKKPDRLTASEFEIMREHAAIGRDIFALNSLPVLQAASVICGQHHERWDGNGYPEGLAGTEIDDMARIVAIADVFDALSNRRCYKLAWPEKDVVSYLNDERGKHFDPNLVDLLLNNIERFREISIFLGDDSDNTTLAHDMQEMQLLK